MIGACPTSIAADALARNVLASADCLIGSEVEQGYATLLAPGGTFATALTIALTIYVAIFAYRLLLGLSSLTLAEVVPHFVKIGLVMALVTSWASYQTLIFNTLFHGPEQFANVIVQQAAAPGATSGDVLSALQEVVTRMIDAASDAWGQTPPVAHVAAPAQAVAAAAAPIAPPAAPPPALPSLGAPQLAAALLWIGAFVLMAASVGVLLVARIILALLLLLGPVFLALALFQSTRGFAEGWLRVTVKFALVPLFALPLIAVAVAVVGPLVAGLGDAPILGVRDGPVLGILLVVLVFAAVMTQAARLGGGIAGSIRLPRRARVVAPTVPGSVSNVVVGNISDASGRAQAIVESLAASGRAGASGSSGSAATVVAATRAFTTAAPQPMVATTSRLGQSYRRLAVAPARTVRTGS